MPIILSRYGSDDIDFDESFRKTVFIENDQTMEVITVKGTAHTLTELSDQLIGIKGIEHGKLIMSKVK